MEIAVFDPKSGAAGDMIIGCLIDAGADREKIKGMMESTAKKIGDIKVEINKTKRNSISCTKVKVISDDNETDFQEMLEAIKNSKLEPIERKLSIKILKTLKKAEDSVHNQKADFHEIGQADAVADIVGTVVGLNDLQLLDKKIISTPIHVGDGYTETKHGKLPVPTPATIEILNQKNIPWTGGPTDKELLTPTGAAILSVIVNQFVDYTPPIETNKTGVGAGDMELKHANILRLYIGVQLNNLYKDTIATLETNIDDISGEEIGYITSKLMNEGALDVSVVPCIMKKGRIGHILRVIVDSKNINKISQSILEETGSLGVRVEKKQHRLIADREIKEISLFGHKIRVKIGKMKDGKIFNIAAEYDDCVKIAEKTDKPLKEIKRKAEQTVRRGIN
ncbi:nickel pincer cofactor biosynthesis protein LarC [Methanonatronarchaeum sp. AMET6-2]|uniref:nickel pincer cofactor biosynthesis protein LarC n=1 Tax=Methanonatronarchaeum sp. AMET6-2 TaxID=2933293 RepID=UPI001FF665C0|nr:nickel pincer cofactor biosynthesis protein LarC [Methanonatronarchaeum sp. AMET6-2]UOY10302.1 nickel pincer cofactor biosynthesis protein LarC [Methanonatronarchaeum sp. AMET6-2]